MQIEIEYNCIGYFGFGNGISMFKKLGSYCNACPIKNECWQLHRERVQQMWPDLAKHIDELGKQPGGQKQIMEFIQKNGSEPYMAVVMGNIEDALQIAHGLPVKERGQYTLKYPFEETIS